MPEIKRYHKTLREAKSYLASLTFSYGLRIWPLKNKKAKNKYWLGTEFEWLNKY